MCIAPHPVEDCLERRRLRLARELGDVRLPQRPFGVACQNRGLRNPRARLLLEARRRDLVEALDRLAEHRLRFVELLLPSRKATEIQAGHQRKLPMSRGIYCTSTLLEQLQDLAEAPLA